MSESDSERSHEIWDSIPHHSGWEELMEEKHRLDAEKEHLEYLDHCAREGFEIRGIREIKVPGIPQFRSRKSGIGTHLKIRDSNSNFVGSEIGTEI